MSNHKEINYLPRFITAHGNRLDTLLGNNNILENGYFGTLRFKKYRIITDVNNNPAKEYLTDTAIDDSWSAYFKIINKKIMKGRFQKKKHSKRKEIPTLAIIEEHANFLNLNHIHFIMVKPSHITGKDFESIIKTTWANMRFGTIGSDNGKLFDIKKIYSRKVIPYIFTEKDFYTPSALHCTSSKRLCL